MASITTILGTDSVSSSRIVINNNFNALNTELGQFASLLNTTTQALSLNGEIKGGTLRINNGTFDTFKVTSSGIIAEVEATFNQKVVLDNALILKIEDAVPNIPSTGYAASTYVLNAILPIYSAPISLSAAEDGQQITFIADGTPTIVGTSPTVTPVIAFDSTNIAGSVIEVGENGSITFVYSATNSMFYVVSAMNATVTY